MSDEAKAPRSAWEFAAKVEQLLAPTFGECFGEETRKARNLFLTASFILILLSLGAVELGKEPVDVKSVGLKVSLVAGAQWMLVALCGYFLAVFGARAYTEWQLWRLRQQAPALELRDLTGKSAAVLGAFYGNAGKAFDASGRLYDRLLELDADATRPAALILKMRLWFEALFPVSFAVCAIAMGILVR